MQRRGIVLLVGFLVAVVVAGGAGVSAPQLPGQETVTGIARVAVPAGRIATSGVRIRVE